MNKKLWADLIVRKFSVYVSGEFERMTDFSGFLKLLVNYSDFFHYDRQEQAQYLREAIASKYGYVDANIFVKIGK